MNEKDLQKELHEMARPAVDASHFKRALKASLLRKHEARHSAFGFVRQLQITNSMSTKFSIPAVALLLLVAIAIAPQFGTNSQVQAAELVKKAEARAYKLSAEQVQAIQARMKHDLFEILEEARQAPDLELFTAEEFKQLMRQEHDSIALRMGASRLVAGEPASEFGDVEARSHAVIGVRAEKVAGTENASTYASPTSAQAGVWVGEDESVHTITFKSPVQYLRFTDSDGRKMTLGVDEDNTPVMLLIDSVRAEEGNTFSNQMEIILQNAN